MVLGIFVLEVMMLTLALGIGSIGPAQVDRTAHVLANGATISVASNRATPIPAADVAAIAGVTRVTGLRTASADIALTPTGATLTSVAVAGSDQIVWNRGAPLLGARDARYPSDESVYDAVRSNDNLVIVNHDFLHDVPNLAAQPAVGQTIFVRNPRTGEHQQF